MLLSQEIFDSHSKEKNNPFPRNNMMFMTLIMENYHTHLKDLREQIHKTFSENSGFMIFKLDAHTIYSALIRARFNRT